MTVSPTDHGPVQRAQNSPIRSPRRTHEQEADYLARKRLSTAPAEIAPTFTPAEITDRKAATDALEALLYRRPPKWLEPSVIPKLKEEQNRSGFNLRNKRLRDRADLIAKNAPTPPCWRTAVHRTSTEVSGSRVKCSSWACLHCSKTKTSSILSEFIERFADRGSVSIVPLADNAARHRFKNMMDKRRQRLGIEIGALVIPVAGGAFIAISRTRFADGEMLDFNDAFDTIVQALESRAEVARMAGKDRDRRRISRPGLDPVRDNAKEESPPLRTNADTADERRPVGMILREVSATDLRDLVALHKGKRGGKARKGGWSYRFATEAEADAFVADLERLYDLTTDEELAENRADKGDRIAWENEQAECFA